MIELKDFQQKAVDKLSMLSGIETKTIKKPNGGKNAQTDSGYIH